MQIKLTNEHNQAVATIIYCRPPVHILVKECFTQRWWLSSVYTQHTNVIPKSTSINMIVLHILFLAKQQVLQHISKVHNVINALKKLMQLLYKKKLIGRSVKAKACDIYRYTSILCCSMQ